MTICNFNSIWCFTKAFFHPLLQQITAKSESEGYRILNHEGFSMLDLRHKNIVELLDMAIVPPNGYLVMEYCVMTLHDYWRTTEGRCLTEEGYTVILGSLAEGLTFIHAKGYIHRDMKSTNVLREFSYLSVQYGTFVEKAWNDAGNR